MRMQLDSAIKLFRTENLKWPGFLEFDDHNGKIVTYSATKREYKVWNLANNYELMYVIEDNNIQEIKLSPGLVLLVFTRTETYVPLQIRSIDNGKASLLRPSIPF